MTGICQETKGFQRAWSWDKEEMGTEDNQNTLYPCIKLSKDTLKFFVS